MSRLRSGVPTPTPGSKKERDLRIEFPMRGMTYHRMQFGVYAYDEYPSSSILAGQPRRTFLDSFDTEFAARAAYPDATRIDGSCYEPPQLSHLPGDDD